MKLEREEKESRCVFTRDLRTNNQIPSLLPLPDFPLPIFPYMIIQYTSTLQSCSHIMTISPSPKG
jgi:hypothetical protein